MNKKILIVFSLILLFIAFSGVKNAKAEEIKPDLIVSSITENVADKSINVTLKNIGAADANLTNSVVWATYGLNNGAVEYDAFINAGFLGKAVLVPGEEYSVLFNKANYLLADINFNSGSTYLVKAYADVYNTVAETNENNNVLEKTVVVPSDAKSDLVISSIFANTTSQSISVTLTNTGTAAANISNSTVRVTYNKNGSANEYEALINAGFLGKTTLAAGEDYSIIFNKQNYLLDDINFQLSTSYTIDAYADYNNTVAESNENNNKLEVPYNGSDVVEHSSNFDVPTLVITPGTATITSENKGIIYWTTNVNANCGVDFSKNSDLSGIMSANGQLIQTGLPTNDGKFYFMAQLSNLTPNTDYYYYIICTTVNGQNATSEIKRLPKSSSVSIIISNLGVPTAAINSNSLTVNWITNVNTDSIVFYREYGQDSWSWQGTSDLSTNHSVNLVGLKPATTYFLYVNAKDANGNVVKSETSWGETAAASAAQNQVKITFPNGGENYQQGEYITIKWQGGKDVVQIGVASYDASFVNGQMNGTLLGWIDTHNYPDGQLVWNGKTICDAAMGSCFNLYPGNYKIIAVSKSTVGNLLLGNGVGGDTGNYDLSDNYFTISSATTNIPPAVTEPVLPAGQDLKSLISSTYGSNYLNHQITNPASVTSGLILFRVIRSCATGAPVDQNYPQLTSFGPGRLVQGHLQEVNLDTANYYNYTCNSRFQEQCIADGTFDSYYDEFCATGVVTASPVATVAAPVAATASIIAINDNASQLYSGSIDSLLAQLNEMKNTIAEQAAQIKYLQSLIKNVAAVPSSTLSNINNFITYGVDYNTVKLGAGQRAAVVNSFKSAFYRLPTTQTDFTDVVKIANGRWPGQTSASSIAWAQQQFQKVYLRASNMSNVNDNAAVTIMAYGLMQQAVNRNLKSETVSINTFENIFGRLPSSAQDWNTVAAIAYSGAIR
ncbi:MAG: CARDB domain-containing protein [Patescibacteria group bacterium]|nr:CARDB domain-containing protein [Patescibacteria group bacterium]